MSASVDQLAARQHGLVTRDQAIAAGMTRSAIHRRVKAGTWLAPRRGVFAFAAVPPTWEQAVLAAVFAGGPVAAASHATAARLWNLPCPAVDALEITTIRERQVRLDGIVAHRSGLIPEADWWTTRGIPVTSPARTAVDLSGRLDDDALSRLVDEALRTRILTLAGLVRCVANLERIAPGRAPAKVRALLAKRLPGYDPGDSHLETVVYHWIIEAGLPPPVRRYRTTIGGNSVTIDLAYPDERIAIETDGYDFHRERRAFDIDRARSNDLVDARWRPLHFTSRSTKDEVVRKVGSLLVQSFPHSGNDCTNQRDHGS